jgi:hypothetical protein
VTLALCLSGRGDKDLATYLRERERGENQQNAEKEPS